MELLAVIGSCAILGVPLLKEICQQKRQAASGAYQIDQMNGRQFEEYLEKMMRQLGYQVERPDPSGEENAETCNPALILSTNGLKIAVRVAHDGMPVDTQAIQAAITAQQRYGCSDTMIISSHDISESMPTLTRSPHVILWTRNDVMKAALSAQRHTPQGLGRGYSGVYPSLPEPSPA